MRKLLVWIALTGTTATVSPGLWAQANWMQGVAAFKNGDYRRALTLFEADRQSGNDSARLKYNIGVTLMKLGRYSDASVYFQMLLSDPEWREIARFNLALAAERRNKKLMAIKHYRRVRETATSQKLRSLAASRLNALAVAERAGATAKRWLATVSVSAGYDDNAYALHSDLLSDASVSADNFTELFAWGQYQLSGTAVDGLRLHGYGFGRRYRTFDSLDLTSTSAGLSRDRQWLGWQTEMGVAGEVVYLGGEPVTKQAQLLARLQREFGEARIAVSYIPSYYSGGGDYAYLDGWRQRFEASWQYPLSFFEVKTYYRYDSNDRADLESGEEDYYSYSPLRHLVGGVLAWNLNGRWHLSTGVEYRQSSYRDANRVTGADGTRLSYQRESERVKSWFAARFKFTPDFSLSGKLVVIDNEENRDAYTYDKAEVSLGIHYVF